MGLSIVKAPARILERCSARSLCARVWLGINASEGKIKTMQSLASRIWPEWGWKSSSRGKKLFLKENAFFWLFHFFITYDGERRGKGKSKMEFYRKKGGEERETVYVLLGQILKGMNICFLLRMERLQWPTEGYMKYNQSILMKKIKDHELVGIV